MELQDLIFALLDFSVALALSEWEYLLCATVLETMQLSF
jgi:hypothetical protein